MESWYSRREVSKHINFLDFKLECLEHRRTPLFIQILGVTVRSKQSTVTMKRSIVDHFENVAAVRSLMERPDEALDMRYKTP